MKLPIWLFTLAWLTLTLPCAAQETPDAQKKVDPDHAAKMAKGVELFKKHVGPIFVARCVKCHGGESTESELDLTVRDKLVQGGASGPVIILGKSQESRLYKMVAQLEEPYMPEDGAKLAATDLAAIAAWIDLGAPYDKSLLQKNEDPLDWTKTTIDASRRDFWSYLPLRLVEPPPSVDPSWSRTPIDSMIQQKAREKNVSLQPLADRRTLIRRAYFDLIGLPPTADETAKFIADADPDAYSKLIDRLLDSPHYGERWGRHWLDIARFGESHGFEQDYDRPYAYHFRDFVIQALNADMPYDQFVRWQLAGDEIEPSNPLALMATGFLGAGVFPTQLTEKEFEPARYDELDDMVSTLGTAMLGLTVGCARCHDHKFDPIPAADYYRMVATFATAIRSEIELDLDPESFRTAKQTWDQAHQPLLNARGEYESQTIDPAFTKWLAEKGQGTKPDAKWQILDLVSFKSTQGATLSKLDDRSILASGDNPKQDHYVFVAETRLPRISALRLDALTHSSLTKQGPGRANNGNFALSDLKITAQPLSDAATATPVKMVDARATHQQDTGHLSVKGSIDEGYESGWAVDNGGIGKNQTAVFDFEKPLDFPDGVRLRIEMRFGNNVQHSIGRAQLSVTSAATPVAIDGELLDQHVIDGAAVLQADGESKLNEIQREALRRWFANRDERWRALNSAVVEHEAKKPAPRLTKVMVTSEGLKPIPHHADDRGFPHFYPEVHFLKRGDTQQKQGVAPAGYLQVLNTSSSGEASWKVTDPAESRTSQRRRALATWATDTQHGAGNLVARVIVNRLWHHHFGRGIVATPSDFGYQGLRPDHPELLEWLAVQLIQNKWQLKSIHKLMMTSAVYMQRSAFDEANFKIDPENAYCWRFAPRRLEAEIIRDSMLAVSGELDRTQFGPGSLEDRMKRRSIYFMVKRSKLIPMMQLFDSPEPLAGVGDRPSTTIAPQSLMFLNSPQVRDYARRFATRLLESSGGIKDELVRASYLSAIAREPSELEMKSANDFLQRQLASYQNDKRSTAEALATSDWCQVLFALNEFIYIE